MSIENWHHQIKTLYQQVEAVCAAALHPTPEPAVLQEAREVLQASMEELRVAEEELHQQHEATAVARQATEVMHQRYQALFDFAPDGYLVTDGQGMIQEANRAAAVLFAVRQDYLVSKPLALFVAPQERSAFRTQLAALAKGQRFQDWAVHLQPLEGLAFDAELTVAAMHSLQDQRPGLLWLIRDVTARKQAEAALRGSEARLHAIVQSAVDGIITIDTHGTIESFNPAAERLFGYTAGAVIGQNVNMLMPLPYREEHDAYLARYLQAGEPKIIGIGREVRGQRRDGTTFPLVLAVSAIDLDGHRMFTGIVHDLTARVQAEEALRQAYNTLEQRVQERTAALQEANDNIRRFAYIVSHDLRAPLINLHGFADELRDACTLLTAALPGLVPHLQGRQRAEVTRALEEEIPEALGFIETAVVRMDRLIEAVLRLSRLGRQEIQRESIDTATLVHETLRTLAHQIAQRQVQVTVEPLPVVHADRVSLAQIFGNLLANAVAYLEPSRPGAIAITAAQHPGVTVFAVQDNGRGIAEDDIPRVFEPFRRVGRQDVPGEGMGLAYVRTLVRRHGGDITCQSTLGAGSTFTFTIAHTLPHEVSRA
jgi:two-component system sensor kinase FixL